MEKEFAAFLLWSQSPTKKNGILSTEIVGQATFIYNYLILHLLYLTKYWYVPGLYPVGTHYRSIM